MNGFSEAAPAIGMVAALLLSLGGLKMTLRSQTRGKGILMILAALVIVMNGMIWTV